MALLVLNTNICKFCIIPLTRIIYKQAKCLKFMDLYYHLLCKMSIILLLYTNNPGLRKFPEFRNCPKALLVSWIPLTYILALFIVTFNYCYYYFINNRTYVLSLLINFSILLILKNIYHLQPLISSLDHS